MTIPILHDENGNEIPWKFISGYHNQYIVYANGQIYSLLKNRFKVFSIRNTGYLRCSLSDISTGKITDFLVHRIVCQAFHGDPPLGCTDVNHLDCNKQNNHASNLEWCTRSENMQHASKHGKLAFHRIRFRAMGFASRRPVEALDDHGKVVLWFPSVGDARHTYTRVNRGLKYGTKEKGYYWRYATPKEQLAAAK